MNENQDSLEDEITQTLQMWDANAIQGVNDSVRSQLMRRVRRSHSHATVRPRFVWIAASSLVLYVGVVWYSQQTPLQDRNRAAAIAHSDEGRRESFDADAEIRELTKETTEALDSLQMKTLLLRQKLQLAELQYELDREQESFQRLERAFDRRTRIDHIILASVTEASGSEQP